MTIDISTPEGQRLVKQLATRADVLIENFKVGGLSQYGLDYASLKELNPRLVYCSITGFGQTGPYAGRAGYDFLIQGIGGLMSLTGRADGTEGEGPMKVGVALTDVMTGLYATVAILAALTRRERSGEGQHIDLALLDVQIACLANQATNYLVSGVIPRRIGNAHPNIVPYQDFPTADGHMIIAVGNDSQFTSLCAALGRPEWAKDECFATNPQRVKHREALIGKIREVTACRATEEWISVMETAGVPCGPINNLDPVFADPQVLSRKVRLEMTHRRSMSHWPRTRSGCRSLLFSTASLRRRLESTRVKFFSLGSICRTQKSRNCAGRILFDGSAKDCHRWSEQLGNLSLLSRFAAGGCWIEYHLALDTLIVASSCNLIANLKWNCET